MFQAFVPQALDTSDPDVTTSAMQAYAQPLDSDLTAIAALSTTAWGRALLTTVATDAMLLPSGTTAQRPASPAVSSVRWNTTTGRHEFWNGSAWVNHARLTGDTFTGAISAPNLSGTNTGDQTNISGNAATVTTNANLTGPITSVGNATSVASQTGTGSTFVMSASPTFTGTVNAAAITASGTVATPKVENNASQLTLNGNGRIQFQTGGYDRFQIGPSNHFFPSVDASYDVGISANRVRGFYGNTLDLTGTVTASGTGTHTFGTTNTVTMAAGVLTASKGIIVSGTSSQGRVQTQGTDSLYLYSTSGSLYLDDGNSAARLTSGVFQMGTRSLTQVISITATGTLILGAYTVATLPSAAANTRARAFVTDSNLAFNSTNLGSTVTAGGSTLVPVFSNGTNWVIG